jgi:surface antigen
MAVPVTGGAALWGANPEDVTGSIARAPAGASVARQNLRLSSVLDDEDLRRAGAAMAAALDPQGNGAVVKWDNPASGAHGAFTPAGFPYPLDGRVCRAFVAELATATREEQLEGAACRDKTADWALVRIGPAKKTAEKGATTRKS